jgi:hypothetical protein
MKIHPVGAELFHADGWTDGQTDMMKLIVAFRNFANAPKTIWLMLYSKIIVFFSEIHTKHINVASGQNVEFLNVKPGGT